MTEDSAELSETDLALVDALTVLTDLLIPTGALRLESIPRLLPHRIRHWTQKGKPKTAAILGIWQQQMIDPERRTQMARDLALRMTPPEGSA